MAILIVWGLGVELLPGLHLAAHAVLPHHHHDGVRAHQHDTAHRGGAHHHHHDGARADQHDTAHHGADHASRCDDHGGARGCGDADEGHGESPADHGANSLAHRQIALLGPPPPPAVVRVVSVEIASLDAAPHLAPRSERPRNTRQRGPPPAAARSW